MKLAQLVCAGVLLLAGSAAAQDGGNAISRTTISLGTATPGGGFPVYGDAFAAAINEAVKLVNSLVTRILAGEWPAKQ